ncbi:hypothetical protein A3H89_01980 [Candidatus Amesbacteria bacterium RIFCSPLOWO2_02_FULL_48_11]|uniref:Uncharacterized protein n=3 Tax=Candidatus Amesiibacteriota TaxID=1752730 RepID=A0A0G1X8R1_9BACT|nr:MAG: hypothetical protein UY22_C0050G0010 [Candidatus Amesbacteria bacterium GW2011_GWC1_48_10]KKU98935.1 MAG: hypothetical protein UY33_C0041G0001 [Candidatus Amesbacteria bacterium GW2011_GWA1_48_9]OGC89167.1 MAG: hypothetical protein A2V48_00830 [Candidatus Amesbacteria bacterium RBG_19FT_COMBO_48_16]OGC99314.1 MAG: hypothetical protein A2W16_03945 [Candidatus Amesbacteria bacterium RBG_16_48_31]OGC99768.1 MAG: hypothetical protein A2702_02820 [Candidatus Amesbacteria bacterium RIFCSPHIGH
MVKKLGLIGAGVAVLAVAGGFFFSRSHAVIRVIDGDTIKVSGYDKSIRLIGIDTAEEGECYSRSVERNGYMSIEMRVHA